MTYSLSVADARCGGLPEQVRASAAREEGNGTSCGVLSRINETMSRFAHADALADLVREAPVRLCEAGDFDRAMISRVRGSTWTPAAVHVAVGADDEVNVTLVAALRALQIPLTGSLIETEVLRHRAPMLVEPMPEKKVMSKM